MMSQQGYQPSSPSGGFNVPHSNLNTPAMDGSMQQVLSENLGRYVVADFLVGVNAIVRRVGILYSVDRSFLVLYEEVTRSYQVCDIFSVKFVSFFPPGFRPTWHLIENPNISGVINDGSGPRLSREQRLRLMEQSGLSNLSDDWEIANLSGLPVAERSSDSRPFVGGMTGGSGEPTRSPETMGGCAGDCTQFRY